jgi:hypothetical protein
MKLPGWSAEAALNTPNQRYQAAAYWRESVQENRVHPQIKGCSPCHRDPDSRTGWSRFCCFSDDPEDCLDRPCLPPQTCSSCAVDQSSPTGFSQQCCRPGRQPSDPPTCTRRPCTPPPVCTIQDNRTCLPWPFDFICWGSCTITCCRQVAPDLVLCGISPC